MKIPMRSLLYPCLCLALWAHAEVAVIVHPSNAGAVSEDDIKNLYLGKKKAFADGAEAITLNLAENSGGRSYFNDKVLGKTDAQLKAYWSKLLFTGKGTPPREVDDAEMLKLVANNPNTIGYVDASKVDASVRVIAKY